MKVTIICFAQLKEFFPPEMQLEISHGTTVRTICEKLIEGIKKNTQTEISKIISHCRFAINDSIVSKDFILSNNSKLCLLPPSSGG